MYFFKSQCGEYQKHSLKEEGNLTKAALYVSAGESG